MKFNFPKFGAIWPNLKPDLDKLNQCLYDELAARYDELNWLPEPPHCTPSQAMIDIYLAASGDLNAKLNKDLFLKYPEYLKFTSQILLERAMALADGSARMHYYCGISECHRGEHE